MKKTELMQELQGKTIEELNTLEQQYRDELFRIRMKHYSGQLQKSSDMRNKRRDIARVLTVRSQKQNA